MWSADEPKQRLAVNFCSVYGPCGSEQLRRNFKRLRKLSHSSEMDSCRRERVFQQGSHCLHSRMRSCHFPEKSASLNTSHETGLGVRDPGLPQEKGPAGRLRQGLPFPDMSSRISLHYVPSLCRWHVQWKIPEHVEQMPLFLLQRSVRVTFSAPAVNPVLLERWFQRSLFWSLFVHGVNVRRGAVWSWRGGWKYWAKSFFEATTFLWGRQFRAAVELTRGTRAEGTDWQREKIKVTTRHRHGNSWPSTQDWGRSCYFFSPCFFLPSLDLATSRCENAILEGWISSAAACGSQVLQEF